MMEARALNRSVDLFFSELRSVLGSNFDDILQELSVPKSELGPNVSAKTLNKISNRLNVTIDSIFNNTVDFETLKAQFQGENEIPSKYRGVEYSSRFSSIYMMSYCRRLMGKEASRFLLQKFQLKDTHFKKMGDKNNILLPSDICEYVNAHYGLEKVREMGESSLEFISQTDLAKNLSAAVKGRDYFDFYFNELLPANVEKNYSWSIQKQGPGYIEVKGKPNPEVVEALGTDHVITPSLETLRLGFLKSIPKLYQDVATEAVQLRSMSHGDSHDLMRLDYSRNHASPATLH